MLDDLLMLDTGDQVVVDGTVVHSAGLEVSEALLTGESEPVPKTIGEPMLSGSFAAAGHDATAPPAWVRTRTPRLSQRRHAVSLSCAPSCAR